MDLTFCLQCAFVPHSLFDFIQVGGRKNYKKLCGHNCEKKQRPVNLDLQTIQFPLLLSHRSCIVSLGGVIMLVAVGILLWLLGTSLSPSLKDFSKLLKL